MEDNSSCQVQSPVSGVAWVSVAVSNTWLTSWSALVGESFRRGRRPAASADQPEVAERPPRDSGFGVAGAGSAGAGAGRGVAMAGAGASIGAAIGGAGAASARGRRAGSGRGGGAACGVASGADAAGAPGRLATTPISLTASLSIS